MSNTYRRLSLKVTSPKNVRSWVDDWYSNGERLIDNETIERRRSKLFSDQGFYTEDVRSKKFLKETSRKLSRSIENQQLSQLKNIDLQDVELDELDFSHPEDEACVEVRKYHTFS